MHSDVLSLPQPSMSRSLFMCDRHFIDNHGPFLTTFLLQGIEKSLEHISVETQKESFISEHIEPVERENSRSVKSG